MNDELIAAIVRVGAIVSEQNRAGDPDFEQIRAAVWEFSNTVADLRQRQSRVFDLCDDLTAAAQTALTVGGDEQWQGWSNCLTALRLLMKVDAAKGGAA